MKVQITLMFHFITTQLKESGLKKAHDDRQKNVHASLHFEGYRFPAHLTTKENFHTKISINVSACHRLTQDNGFGLKI